MKAAWTGLLVLAAVLCVSAPGHAFKEGGQDCAKCHTLTEKDMAPIFEKINVTGAKVLGIRMSPVKGLWEVAVESNGQRFLVYVDIAKKYISPGPFFDYANKKDITGERISELNKDRKVKLEGLSLDHALVVGKVDAPIKVVVFTDPGLPLLREAPSGDEEGRAEKA